MNNFLVRAVEAMERAAYAVISVISCIGILAAGMTSLMGIIAAIHSGTESDLLDAGGVFLVYSIGPFLIALLVIGIRQMAITGKEEVPIARHFFPEMMIARKVSAVSTINMAKVSGAASSALQVGPFPIGSHDETEQALAIVRTWKRAPRASKPPELTLPKRELARPKKSDCLIIRLHEK